MVEAPPGTEKSTLLHLALTKSLLPAIHYLYPHLNNCPSIADCIAVLPALDPLARVRFLLENALWNASIEAFKHQISQPNEIPLSVAHLADTGIQFYLSRGFTVISERSCLSQLIFESLHFASGLSNATHWLHTACRVSSPFAE